MRVYVMAGLMLACSSAAAQQVLPAPVVVLERNSDCFGRCPSYELSIFGDGRVVYEGRRNVATLGRRESRVAPQQVTKLVQLFLRNDFSGMAEYYPTSL